MTIGSSEIELVCNTAAQAEPVDGTVNHLTFTVDDIAGDLERLRSHGVTLLNEEPVHLAQIGARIAFFRGPDGEKLELLQRD
jgi:lactoylglutathione lyase